MCTGGGRPRDPGRGVGQYQKLPEAGRDPPPPLEPLEDLDFGRPASRPQESTSALVSPGALVRPPRDTDRTAVSPGPPGAPRLHSHQALMVLTGSPAPPPHCLPSAHSTSPRRLGREERGEDEQCLSWRLCRVWTQPESRCVVCNLSPNSTCGSCAAWGEPQPPLSAPWAQ